MSVWGAATYAGLGFLLVAFYFDRRTAKTLRAIREMDDMEAEIKESIRRSVK